VGEEGLRVLGGPAAVDRIEADLGLEHLGAEIVEWLRIDALRPAIGTDVTERSFPQEARLESSCVSFAKGCYIGQEIVARIQSRGSVNRLLVRLEAEEPLSAGGQISIDGRGVGQVTSAAHVPTHGCRALGYVRAEHAHAGVQVHVASVPARITGP